MAGTRRDGQDHVCRIRFCHRDGPVFLAARYGSHFSDSIVGRSNRLMNSELSMSLRWYVVHAYSNFEHKVSESLKERVKRAGLEAKFGEILVPTEEVVEMRDGQKRKSDRKFFPGYVLVQMEMDEDTWHLVKEVPKVLGFIGGRPEKTAPITGKEGKGVFRCAEGRRGKPKAESRAEA